MRCIPWLWTVLILPVGGAANIVSLSSNVVIFMKDVYLEELLETCILYSFNAGCYDWTVSA
jgi:hypothetical protein